MSDNLHNRLTRLERALGAAEVDLAEALERARAHDNESDETGGERTAQPAAGRCEYIWSARRLRNGVGRSRGHNQRINRRRSLNG